jgi:hypothetical protein
MIKLKSCNILGLLFLLVAVPLSCQAQSRMSPGSQDSRDPARVIVKYALKTEPNARYFASFVDLKNQRIELFFLAGEIGRFVCRAGYQAFHMANGESGKSEPYVEATYVYVSDTPVTKDICANVPIEKYILISDDIFTDGTLIRISKFLRKLNTRNQSKFNRLIWLGIDRAHDGLVFGARFIGSKTASEGWYVYFDFSPDADELRLLGDYQYITD